MLSSLQKEKLLEGVNPMRTSKRAAKRDGSGPKFTYMEAWEIKAHLNRIFGIGGWSWRIVARNQVYVDAGVGQSGKNYEVGYELTGDLTIFSIGPDGQDAVYSGSAVGTATGPTKSDCFDNAVKNADSDAIKRAAIMLGDQFGLSLYNDGRTKPVVVKVFAPGWDGRGGSVEDIPNVDPETGLATDDEPTEPPAKGSPSDDAAPVEEFDPTPDDSAAIGSATDTPPSEEEVKEAADNHPGAMEFVAKLREAMKAKDVKGVIRIKAEISSAGAEEWMFEGRTLAKLADMAVVHAGKRG